MPLFTIVGRLFYFKINGKSIFIKGANYVMDSILPEKNGDPETIEHLLHSVKIAHMNMIRVWGGGRYESDLFYEVPIRVDRQKL